MKKPLAIAAMSIAMLVSAQADRRYELLCGNVRVTASKNLKGFELQVVDIEERKRDNRFALKDGYNVYLNDKLCAQIQPAIDESIPLPRPRPKDAPQ